MTTPDAVAVDALADAAASALVAYGAARDEAARATEAARVARADAFLVLHDAGWSVRRIARELEVSSALVGQVLQLARANRTREWGAVENLPRIDSRGNALDSFYAARHAQNLREEDYTSGGEIERAAFYGALDAPAVDEAERSLTWRAWLQGSVEPSPMRS